MTIPNEDLNNRETPATAPPRSTVRSVRSRSVSADGRPLEVLVVDDEPMVREVVSRYLDRDGLDVHELGDGDEAIRWLDSHRPDLVVLDVMLPGVDGLCVLRRLRERGHVPVIVLTARTDELDRVLGLELGADDYVVKPFSPRELAVRVRNVLRRVGGRRRRRRDGPLEFGPLRIDPAAREVVGRRRAPSR